VLIDGVPAHDWEYSEGWLLVRLDARTSVRHVHVVAAPTLPPI
jgi:hypothetical protein